MTKRDADALGKSGHGTPSPSLPTPGPWTWDEQAGWVVCGWFGIHKVPAFNDASRDTHLANARLIAAAPELLAEGQETAAELEGLADWLDSIDAAAGIARNLRAIEKRWRAAIAKATQP